MLLNNDVVWAVLSHLGNLDYLPLARVCRVWQHATRQAWEAWRTHHGFVMPRRPELVSCPPTSSTDHHEILEIVSPRRALDVALMPSSFPHYPGQRRCDTASADVSFRPAAEFGVRVRAFKHALGRQPEEDCCSRYDDDDGFDENCEPINSRCAPQ